MSLSFKEYKSIIKQAVSEFLSDEAFTRAASVSFYMALSLSPLLLLFISLTNFIDPTALAQITSQAQEFIGPAAKDVVELMINSAQSHQQQNLISLLIGSVILLFSSSVVFVELQDAINPLWNITSTKSRGIRGWIRKRLISMELVIIFFILILTALAITAIITIIFDSRLWQVGNILFTFLFLGLIFSLLFKTLVAIKIPWTTALVGGLTTSILFMIGNALVGFYLRHSTVSSAYGAAGSLIIVLLWVYYSTLIVFFGAELTQSYLQHQHKERKKN